MGESQEKILAIVTTDKGKVLNSGAPVFLVGDRKEQERLSLILGRILKGMPHDLENGVYVIIRH